MSRVRPLGSKEALGRLAGHMCPAKGKVTGFRSLHFFEKPVFRKPGDHAFRVFGLKPEEQDILFS